MAQLKSKVSHYIGSVGHPLSVGGGSSHSLYHWQGVTFGDTENEFIFNLPPYFCFSLVALNRPLTLFKRAAKNHQPFLYRTRYIALLCVVGGMLCNLNRPFQTV